jgi:phage shock protein C
MEKKLFRRKENSLIGGVCSGIADYLSINPLWVRLFFVIWTVAGGASILIYFILWVVMPAEGDSTPIDLNTRLRTIGNEISEIIRRPNSQLITYAGLGLIGLGVLFLIRQFGFLWADWVNWDLIWPVMLMVAGVVLLVRAISRRN